MPKFIIEREMPGAGNLSPDQIQHAAQHSCNVLGNLRGVQWLESYVTDDKVYCVYIAPNSEAIREHAQQSGFPANRISQIRGMIDPTSAEPGVRDYAAC